MEKTNMDSNAKDQNQPDMETGNERVGVMIFN